MAWSWQGGIPQPATTAVSLDGARLATLVPLPAFEPARIELSADARYVLSRFAYLHCDDGEMVLESPLAHARIVLHDWRAAAIVHMLAAPRRVAELARQMPHVDADAVRSLLALLVASSMASHATTAGGRVADESVALRSWEFHDLLFHARTRGGRHDQPVGATYRFLGELEPPPPLAQPISTAAPVALYRPELEHLAATDPPFTRVQEARRSIRVYDARPLTVRQLGEFLYRVGRVTDFWEDELRTPRATARVAAAARPYPAAGGLYELDLYVVVNRCEGLAAGFYRHDPERHALCPHDAPAADLERLLADASFATMIPLAQLQVLIVIAARFQRVAWKYASIAYNLLLKDVGVLFDTMYLTATAMGLAPCAIGCGNADLFAQVAGRDYYAETSVGEFLLGSRRSETDR